MARNLQQLEHDRLNSSDLLARSNSDLAREAVFKDVQATLAGIIQRADDLLELCNRVTEFFALHTEAQMGALYVRSLGEGEGEGRELQLYGNFAFPQEHAVGKNLAGAELVSQAARSRKSILISDVPNDYIKVTSGLGEALPRNVLVVPLFDGAQLKGVMELGALGEFADEQIAEIETLVQPVAAAISVKQGAEKIRSLLTATQQQAMELQVANEESDRDKCINAGCDDYTTKPINRTKLISLVAQYASQQTHGVVSSQLGNASG